MLFKPKSSQLLRGIDVSEFQKTFDWSTVKAAGISFAFIKASEGMDYQDAYFSANWQNARAAGVIRGAYHFFRPKTAGQAQVDNFVNMVGQLQDGDLPPVLDLEVPQDWVHIPVAKRMPLIIEWLTKVEAALGVRPIVYMSPSFVKKVLGGDASALSGYDLWIAEYGVSAPAVPAPWSVWRFWQYSETGTVRGISGAVDLDVYNGSSLSFNAMRVTASPWLRFWRRVIRFLNTFFGLF